MVVVVMVVVMAAFRSVLLSLRSRTTPDAVCDTHADGLHRLRAQKNTHTNANTNKEKKENGRGERQARRFWDQEKGRERGGGEEEEINCSLSFLCAQKIKQRRKGDSRRGKLAAERQRGTRET